MRDRCCTGTAARRPLQLPARAPLCTDDSTPYNLTTAALNNSSRPALSPLPCCSWAVKTWRKQAQCWPRSKERGHQSAIPLGVKLADPQSRLRQNIGRFASEEDAATAYDCAAVQPQGPGAKRNFPDEAISELPVTVGEERSAAERFCRRADRVQSATSRTIHPPSASRPFLSRLGDTACRNTAGWRHRAVRGAP
jgi:hypothetical protein